MGKFKELGVYNIIDSALSLMFEPCLMNTISNIINVFNLNLHSGSDFDNPVRRKL